jgi:hypothetical protein
MKLSTSWLPTYFGLLDGGIRPLLRLFPDFPATFEKPLGYRRAPTGGNHEARDKAWSSAAEL